MAEGGPQRPEHRVTPPAGRACKLIDLARSVGEQGGNAELGHDLDRLRDPISPNEGQKLLDRSVHQTRRS
jgi:hypothetical protein